MSTQLKKNLQELSRNIKVHAPKVKAKVQLSKGSAPDCAVTVSTAKYFDALRRLAQE